MAAGWSLFAISIAVFLFLKLQVSFDLSAFFPTRTGPDAEILLQQLSSGPGSRTMVVGINGSEVDDRLESGRLLTESLKEYPGFSTVFNGEVDLVDAEIPEPVTSGYPLMTDIDFSPGALESALQQRLADMSFSGGRAFRTLVANDPYLASLDLLSQLGPGIEDEPWVAGDGSVVITAQTHAAGTDLQAQAEALGIIRDSFDEVKTHPDLELTITGVGAFGIQLQSIIQKESRLLGILAGSAIMLVLLVVYRSLKLALLAAIPLTLGMLAGVTAVALVFGTVHGITLAFGFTLLGVTVDYPLHLFSHARQQGGSKAIRSIWPTLRLGAASTATAYLAMVFSGAQGLSQLGVFTAVGVLVALLVTRTLLPGFLHAVGPTNRTSDEEISNHLRFGLAVAGLLIVVGILAATQNGQRWNDSMDTLSPVPRDLLKTDQQLRSATAPSDMRYQVTVKSDNLETLLQESERVDVLLGTARDQGLLQGWSSITTLLPSQASQQRRLDALPNPEDFEGLLSQAVSETTFSESAFDPFRGVISSARDVFPLSPQSFDDTPLETWRDVHLVELQDQWVALYTLKTPDAAQLGEQVSSWGESVRWIDLQDASGKLMMDFRHDATRAVALAALVILVLLVLQRTGLSRLAWIAVTVTAALAVAISVVISVHGFLTLVHLVALLLVLGLGLDYALFFSREESSSDRKATLQSILACSASTTLAFGILAMSTIPLLKFIGLTVATGSIASLLFAWLGSRRAAPAR